MPKNIPEQAIKASFLICDSLRGRGSRAIVYDVRTYTSEDMMVAKVASTPADSGFLCGEAFIYNELSNTPASIYIPRYYGLFVSSNGTWPQSMLLLQDVGQTLDRLGLWHLKQLPLSDRCVPFCFVILSLPHAHR